MGVHRPAVEGGRSHPRAGGAGGALGGTHGHGQEGSRNRAPQPPAPHAPISGQHLPLARACPRQPASGERKEMQPAGQTCLQGESRWATLGAEGLRGASREDPARDDPQGPPGTREHSRNPAGILCAKAVDVQKSSTGRARKREHRK